MSVLVGIHRNPDDEFDDVLRRYETILDQNKIDHIRLSTDDPDFWDKVKELSLFVYIWKHDDRNRNLAHTIIPIIENELKIQTYPNSKTCWHYDDKVRQWYLLKNHQIPMIQSWIFWGREKALKWSKEAPLPIIFKLKGGAGSTNVLKLDTRKQVEKMIQLMFGKGVPAKGLPKSLNKGSWKRFLRWLSVRKRRWQGQPVPYTMRQPSWESHRNYIYFQKFLPGNDGDVRITVIGNRAFGFRRMNRPNDFRASGSGLIDYNKDGIDLKCVKIAFNTSQKLGFQSMAYDFLKSSSGDWQIGEISYLYVDKAIWQCPGYWNERLEWVEGQFWPQYCQLADALKNPDLKQA